MFLNISSGKLKGTPIFISNIKKYKITSLILKKIIFNWINLNKDDKCIDLFAGSGCLGFEIFSKYNCNLFLIENNFYNYKFLLFNKRKITSNKIKIYNISALSFLKNVKRSIKYDLVFLDPPFINVKKIFFYIKLISNILKINGRILLESIINYSVVSNYFNNDLKLINFKRINKVNLFLFENKKF